MTEEIFVQWNGSVHSSLGRNLGQATATYGRNWIGLDEKGVPRIRSSAIIEGTKGPSQEGVYPLEKAYEKLTSPEWAALVKAGVVPELNQQKARLGQKLFAKNCQSCHAIQPESSVANAFGNQYWKVQVLSPSEIGTDPEQIDQAVNRRAFIPEALEAPYKQRFGDSSVDVNHQVSASNYRFLMLAKMILDYFDVNGIDKANQARLANYRVSADPNFIQQKIGYKARSLEGIIFTAPYLHNGSVPTLDDLLKPAAKRPKVFFVGCHKYDIKKMGYDCDSKSMNAELFDTTLETNSNQGHEAGSFSSAERSQLIEYLKSLRQPEPAPKKAL